MREYNVLRIYLMFIFPPNSYTEFLIFTVMVLRGGTFGRSLGHGGRALINGISVLIKVAPESCFTLCHMRIQSEVDGL